MSDKIEVLLDHPNGPHVLCPVDDPSAVEDALPVGFSVGSSWTNSPPDAEQADGRWLLRLERMPMSDNEIAAAGFAARCLEAKGDPQRYTVMRLFREVERLREENTALSKAVGQIPELVHDAATAELELYELLTGMLGDDKPRLRALKRASAFLVGRGCEAAGVVDLHERLSKVDP